MTNKRTLMWLFTIILFLGFMITYKNLNGETVFTDSKYEGLMLSLFGLIASVYVGVNTVNNGKEGFINLFIY